ncbi:hypothetical protein Btru_070351 [Bulinus truncatus]|nr:hypothetical protein Btru_070351 [Bulinus truncatus]
MIDAEGRLFTKPFIFFGKVAPDKSQWISQGIQKEAGVQWISQGIQKEADQLLTMELINFTVLLIMLCHVTGAMQDVNLYPSIFTTKASSPCKQRLSTEGLTVDCGGLGLHTINNAWFPPETNVILLTNNTITVIQSNAFDGLSHLRVLDLSKNNINKIDSNAFVNLSSLENLNMEFNRLDLFTLPQFVFCPLINVRDLRLWIQRCKEDVASRPGTTTQNQYPPGMFGCLHNLVNFTVDTLGGILSFNEQFRNLTNLTRIGLSCELDMVNPSSFENVKNISFFSLGYAYSLRAFDALALSTLTNLDVFSLKFVSTGLHQALILLKPLVNKNMTAIILTEVIKAYYDKSLSIKTGDGILTQNVTQYLTSICVSKVGLSRNSIFVIETGALTSGIWNRCLKEIDLRGNYILGRRESIMPIFTLNSLETALMSTVFNTYTDDLNGNIANIWQSSQSHHALNSPQGSGNLMSRGKYLKVDKNRCAQSRLTVYVSPSLRILNLNRFVGDTDFSVDFIFKGADNLEVIDFSYNDGFHFLGNITGLSALVNLSFSGNYFSVVSKNFFDNLPKLKALYLSQCKFDTVFMSKYSNRLFQSLTQLTDLDLSYNSLTILSAGTFESNRKLTFLNLEGNRFTSIPIDLRMCPSLLSLNIKINSFTSLDQRSMKMLEDSVTRTGQFNLSLSGNLLSCSCSNFLFLEWIQETRVSLENNGNYTCLDNDFQLSCTKCIQDFEDLWRKCSGQEFLYASIVMLCTTLISILLVFLLSQKKIFLLSMLYEFVNGFRLNTINDYPHKVYVVQTETCDRSRDNFITHVLTPYFEDVLGLRTFLTRRDGLPGLTHLAAHLDPIPDSWRVVFLLSRGFECDKMLQFVVSTSIAAQSPANPGQLVFLVQEDYFDLVPNEWINAVPPENIILLSTLELTYRVEQTLRTRLLQ